MNIPYVFKKCSKCGEWLVANKLNFYKDKSGKYSLRGDCKSCHGKAHKNHRKQYYKNNREYYVEYRKRYYATNKEKLLLYHKIYYINNKEKLNEYRINNREKFLIYNKKWYYKHKKDISIYKKKYSKTPQGQVISFNSSSKRRYILNRQGNGITKEQWLECMKFFGFRCAYSGQILSKDIRSLDHIVPLSKGGEHEIWNVVPMYKPYNISKFNNNMLEWYVKQPFFSEERLQKIHEWQEYAFNKWSK